MSKKRATPSGVLILPEGQKKDASVLRARDVRFELQGKGIDPAVISILERLAEAKHHLFNQLNEMAQLQSRMIDTIQQFSDIAGNMKDKMHDIERGLSGGGIADDIHTAEN